MSADQLWEVLYPGKAIKEGVLRVKIRQLTRQLEEYLAWEEMQQDEQLKSRLILQARMKYLPYEDYERESLKLLRKIPDETESGVDDYYRRIQLQAGLVRHPQVDHYRGSGRYLQELTDSLDAFFLLGKYRLISEVKSRERILGEQYEIRFQRALRAEHASGFLSTNKTARLYERLFQMQEFPDHQKLLEELKTDFLNDHGSLEQRDLENIYFSTLNHLSRRINQGGSHHYAEMLTWYQYGLDSGILLKDGRITGITFSNIALLGFRAGRFRWTYDFLENFAEALDEKERADTLVSCRAMGAFYAADYRKTIEIINAHRFSLAYRLRARLTLIRSYYELLLRGEDVYEQLDRAIGRFDAFLSRNQSLSKSVREPFRRHVRLLRKLLNLKMQGKIGTEAAGELRREIDTAGAVVSKQWLLDKLKN